MPQGTHFQFARESIREMAPAQAAYTLAFIPGLRTTRSAAEIPQGYTPPPDTVNFSEGWSIRSDHHHLRFVALFGHPIPETYITFTPDEWMRAVAVSREAAGDPIQQADLPDWALMEARRLRILAAAQSILTHHDTSPDAFTLEENYQDALTLAAKGIDLARLVQFFGRMSFGDPAVSHPAEAVAGGVYRPGDYRAEIERASNDELQQILSELPEDGTLADELPAFNPYTTVEEADTSGGFPIPAPKWPGGSYRYPTLTEAPSHWSLVEHRRQTAVLFAEKFMQYKADLPACPETNIVLATSGAMLAAEVIRLLSNMVFLPDNVTPAVNPTRTSDEGGQ